MRTTFLILSAMALAACTRGNEEQQMVADSPATALAVPLSFADFAGKWSVQTTGEMSDSVTGTFDLNATADGSGWTLTPTGSEPVQARVMVDGDSLIIDAGPYKSADRKPVDVTTHVVARLEGGQLVGTYLSRRSVTTADSVLRGRVQGARAP